jgi:hypothetical protein
MPKKPDDEAAWEGLLTWNYRIVRTADAAGVSYAIYEVYDDADGRPHARTVQSSSELMLVAHSGLPDFQNMDGAVFRSLQGRSDFLD